MPLWGICATMKTAVFSLPVLFKTFLFAAVLSFGLTAVTGDALSQAKQQRKFGTLAGPNAPQKWSLVQEKSKLSYINSSASNRDIPITNYDMELNFDPNKLDQSRMVLTADISSMFLPARAVNVDLLEYLPPTTQVHRGLPSTAVFMSTAIKRRNASEFVAEGGLRVGEKSKPIAIPFTVTLDRNVPGGMMIILKGGFTANRTDFATESFAGTGGAEVPVKFELAAVPVI